MSEKDKKLDEYTKEETMKVQEDIIEETQQYMEEENSQYIVLTDENISSIIESESFVLTNDDVQALATFTAMKNFGLSDEFIETWLLNKQTSRANESLARIQIEIEDIKKEEEKIESENNML